MGKQFVVNSVIHVKQHYSIVGGIQLKAFLISFAIAIVLYGISLYISALVKRPILCSNVFIAFASLCIALRSFFERGVSSIDQPIIIISLLLLFSLIHFVTIGLKYSIGVDMDVLNNELISLKFTPEGQKRDNKTHKYFAPNGTKIIAKQYPQNKFIEIRIVNGIRFKRINDVRTSLLPVLKKYTVNSNLKLNSILIILSGLVLFGIYLFI
jgi:hypothetical protein